MTELMRFHSATGSVIVEVDEAPGGYGQVDRGSGVIADAKTKIDAALAEVRDTAENALRTFREASLRPDGVELEFGVKLTAEAGAVIAKTAVEGHFKVRLSWNGTGPDEDDEPAAEAKLDA